MASIDLPQIQRPTNREQIGLDLSRELCYLQRSNEPEPCTNPNSAGKGNGLKCKKHCGAALKNKPGKFCKRIPYASSGRCQQHGGASLSGIASSSTKLGIYSKYMPVPLQERHAEVANDPDLLALRGEIAVSRVMVTTAIEKIDTGEATKLWESLSQLKVDLDTALSIQDFEMLAHVAARVSNVIDKAERIEAGRTDFYKAVESLRRLIETEQKRVEKMAALVRLEDVNFVINRFLTSIQEHVSDAQAKSKIDRDIRGFLRNME